MGGKGKPVEVRHGPATVTDENIRNYKPLAMMLGRQALFDNNQESGDLPLSRLGTPRGKGVRDSIFST